MAGYLVKIASIDLGVCIDGSIHLHRGEISVREKLESHGSICLALWCNVLIFGFPEFRELVFAFDVQRVNNNRSGPGKISTIIKPCTQERDVSKRNGVSSCRILAHP